MGTPWRSPTPDSLAERVGPIRSLFERKMAEVLKTVYGSAKAIHFTVKGEVVGVWPEGYYAMDEGGFRFVPHPDRERG